MKEKLWGAIEEVDRGVIYTGSKWSELYHELRLRLERTDPSAALAIHFIDRKLAKTAEGALRKFFARDLPLQPLQVTMGVRKYGEGVILYVCWSSKDHKLPGTPVHSRRKVAKVAED